jgi:transmembrane sensor
MQITKQQIARFLHNECAAEEAKQIADYLSQHPNVLNDFLDEQEWQQFKTESQVDPEKDQAMLTAIQQNKNKRLFRVRTSTWMRVAAAVLLFVSGWVIYQQMSRPTAPAKNSNDLPVAMVRREVILSNTTKKEARYVLEDSSTIILSKNSTVTYYTPFETNKRDLHLQGEAIFTVTKDSRRPFTVFAKGFSTTALGTEFKIKAYANDTVAQVKLLTGRVVVKNLRVLNNAIYLSPGEQCAFNYSQVNLRRTEPLVKITPPKRPPPQPEGSIEVKGDSVIFHKTRLPAVMQKLSELYGVRISYDTAAIKDKRFIGTIARQSPLEEVLQTISLLNDLQFVKQDDYYIITAR